jgi:glycogen debranching enzyme
MSVATMDEVIKVHDQFYIQATASPSDERTRVLKQGETFAVFDRFGDVRPYGLGELGLYHEGTRYLSLLELRMASQRPLLLSSTVRQTNDVLVVDLTNPDVTLGDAVLLPKGQVHVFRSKFLWQAVCYERLLVSNYGAQGVELSLVLNIEADFADIFEVRGVSRARRGRRLETLVEKGSVVMGYVGLDDVTRRTRVSCDPLPQATAPSSVRYDLRLAPQETRSIGIAIACERQAAPAAAAVLAHDQALEAAEAEARRRRCAIDTSNPPFNEWIHRSFADVSMMLTETPAGSYPYAGVPWFSAPFGRDGIITALELLWLDPQVARGVLGYLAAHQAEARDPLRDAEPGKILHETRLGEMAALHEIPFGCYYGSIDATPLFVVLAGAYYERTADRAFIESLWPHVERAIEWIERYGDRDGDGFVEYARENPRGLVHQGWKDSQDSVFHEDGSLAEAPIALCEVQGYVYAARRHAADLAAALGLPDRAAALRSQAAALRQRFEERFWCEDLETYALALDGRKRPCRVRSSNAGQCLFTGIADPGRARRMAETLMAPESFSGWGVRTLAAVERRYNPMSYHNGSVWPHDNALIAAGFARYGRRDLAEKLLASLFDATLFLELRRLPELFCGFHRRPGQGPTLYPVACAPQAWAAGAAFLLLQACLGLGIDAARKRITFTRPRLPPFLDRVRITHLAVGEAEVDLFCERHDHDVGIRVAQREGDGERPEILMVP